MEKVVSGPSGWVAQCPVASKSDHLIRFPKPTMARVAKLGKSQTNVKNISTSSFHQYDNRLIMAHQKDGKILAGVSVPLLLTARGDHQGIKSAGERNNKHCH